MDDASGKFRSGRRGRAAKGAQFVAAVALAALLPARAIYADNLPYPIRTKPYSAAETTVNGDIRTVGMAGATVGLADTFIASVDNPSGLAMTIDQGDDTLTGNHVHDGHIQNYDNLMNSGFVGVALAPYPWGFGLGYVSLYQEGQPYVIPGASDTDPVPLQVVTRELQFSASRLLLNDRLSLGATLRLGQAEEDIDLGSSPMTAAFHSYAVGATLGAMWQLPRRWLLGISYQTPMRYSVNAATVAPTLLPGFFQPVYTPSRLGLGVGWIPNRFFRASVSATLIGSSPNTALLSDQNTLVGVNSVWEPRIGASYAFVDYKELRGTLFAGTYYEVSRIVGEPNRWHGTSGIEIKPWIFTVGVGIDGAKNYENYLLGISVDAFKVLAKLDVIPTPWHPPYTGFNHAPFTSSDVGLARPLVKDWRPRGPDMDPFDIGLNIPGNLQRKAVQSLDQVQQSFGDLLKSVTGDVEEPTPEPSLIPPPAEALKMPDPSVPKADPHKPKHRKKKKPSPTPSPTPNP